MLFKIAFDSKLYFKTFYFLFLFDRFPNLKLLEIVGTRSFHIESLVRFKLQVRTPSFQAKNSDVIFSLNIGCLSIRHHPISIKGRGLLNLRRFYLNGLCIRSISQYGILMIIYFWIQNYLFGSM